MQRRSSEIHASSELARDMRRRLGARIISPRLVRPEDAALLRKTLELLDPGTSGTPEPSNGG